MLSALENVSKCEENNNNNYYYIRPTIIFISGTGIITFNINNKYNMFYNLS